ncbi:isoamylase early set domain-containing protein [Thalassotalea ponticola]|uniref:isoamylase early set domain-containing protein n=1 Tax=Thalassotalea ponticola TaxID=1523392 RepID=UPI0025B4733B|nr:isoamylase early set domain-containing protein [Thalassotalea ponticola]MDN3651917.1 isoamylase early set domain-containing protein [Thalassotalea ponticola]
MLNKKFFKTKNEAEVTFAFARDDINDVLLYADFNNWQPIKMSYVKSSNSFKAKVRLPKDCEFEFRYLLNGSEWENDYCADAYRANEFGSDNSIVSTHTHCA